MNFLPPAVDWWYKNGDKGDEFFSIVYVDNSNRQKVFYPDYIISVRSEPWIIEIKGGFDRTGAYSDDVTSDAWRVLG